MKIDERVEPLYIPIEIDLLQNSLEISGYGKIQTIYLVVTD